MKTFFFFDFDEDDIITNLADAAPGNDVFAFSAGKKTEFAGTWNDESSDGSCFAGRTPDRPGSQDCDRYRY